MKKIIKEKMKNKTQQQEIKTIIREMKIGNEENHLRERKNKKKQQEMKKIIREMRKKNKKKQEMKNSI